MGWLADIPELLWRSAWAVIPVALLVMAACRWLPCQPVTRHALWVIVLCTFLMPLAAPFLPLPTLVPPSDTEPKALAEDLVDFSGVFVSENANPGALDPAASTRGRPANCPRATLAKGALRVAAVAAAGDSAPLTVALEPIADAAVPDCRIVAMPVSRPMPLTRVAPAVFESRRAAPTQRPEASPPKAAEPTARGVAWKAWIVGLAAVRDALANLPTLPTNLWLAGTGVVLAVYVGGTLRFRRRLRRAEPAAEPVRRVVTEIAQELGLRRAPAAFMVDQAISPLVWCGRRVRLMLPARLWADLDRIGQKAIVCHELAHLRRKDHWVRWLELLISAVFWWHPLVWWIRRRVHEEADLCCDAWVTWLMPRRRRAYAEALVMAREHASAGNCATPVVAMGAMTSGAKRFARRITMIMTRSSRPGFSQAGIGLAFLLALVGWVVTPAFSSPPKQKCGAKAKTIVVTADAGKKCDAASGQAGAASCSEQCRKICDELCAAICGEKCNGSCKQACAAVRAALGAGAGAKTCVVACGQGKSISCNPAGADGPSCAATCGGKKVVVRKSGDSQAYSVVVKDDGDPQPGEYRVQVRGAELQGKMAKLQAELARIAAELEALQRQALAPAPPAPPTPPAPPAPLARAITIGPPGLLRVGEGEKEIVRAYKLPEGRREALTKLMVRDDVPVRVSPTDDGIEVHGSPWVQRIFKAFVDMITKEGDVVEAYELPEGKLDALSELMTRDDVPIRVRPLEDRIEVHGSSAEQSVFGAFVDLINPGEKKAAFYVTEPGGMRTAYTSKGGLGGLCDLKVAIPEIEVPDIGLDVPEIDVDVELEGLSGELTRDVLKAVQELLANATEVEVSADALREKAENIKDDASQGAKALRQQARELDRQARELERKARELERRAEKIREKGPDL